MEPAKIFTQISSHCDAKARAEENGKFQINTQSRVIEKKTTNHFAFQRLIFYARWSWMIKFLSHQSFAHLHSDGAYGLETVRPLSSAVKPRVTRIGEKSRSRIISSKNARSKDQLCNYFSIRTGVRTDNAVKLYWVSGVAAVLGRSFYFFFHSLHILFCSLFSCYDENYCDDQSSLKIVRVIK